MANTVIQFRRSAVTAAPTAGTLAAGQPSYSFNSDKLFLGNTNGTGILLIGGAYYTGIIDGATSANAANNLVKRDANGSFAGQFITGTAFIGSLYGTANLAAALTPGRFIATQGDVVVANTLFDGTTNINATATLSTTGVVAATYGEGVSGTKIGVFTVDAKGRITAASNVATPAGATFTLQGNTGSNVATSGNFLNFYGGDGMSAGITVSGNTGNVIILHAVDSTVVRTSGVQTVGGDKTFTGNITITGTTTYANATNLLIGDNIITLNADIPVGTAPTENAGIEINRGNQNGNASIYWDETNKWWTAPGNILVASATTLNRIWTDSYANASAFTTGTVPSARISGSYPNITGLGTITVGTWNASLINVQYGGTGQSTFILNGVIYGAGANGALLITAAPTEGQMLQGNISGVPTFGGIDGGTF